VSFAFYKTSISQHLNKNWVILPNPNYGGNIVGYETSQTDSNTVYIGIHNEFRFYIQDIPVHEQFVVFSNEKINGN